MKEYLSLTDIQDDDVNSSNSKFQSHPLRYEPSSVLEKYISTDTADVDIHCDDHVDDCDDDTADMFLPPEFGVWYRCRVHRDTATTNEGLNIVIKILR